MNKKILVSLGAVVIISVALFFTLKSNVAPLINVSDQSVGGGQVLVSDVTAIASSWLVIQTETNGVPGPVIGYTKINKGENKNVSITIDVSKSTPKLFAMIHEDSGEKGKFDFPSDDMPLIYKGDMVSKLFITK